MTKIFLRRVLVFVISVLSVVAIVYALNFWWWNYAAPKAYLAKIHFTQNEALFVEGILLVTVGLLFMLGTGGINLGSLKAAILGSLADAIYGRRGQRAPGPSEIFRRDAWRPSGFVRFGLVVVFAGIILILLYFL